MSEQVGSSITLGIRRLALEARVIKACNQCGAPGAYKNHPSIQSGWPGCYDPKRDGREVGPRCPNCGAKRPSDENLGEVQASMSMWLWRLILGFKWVLLKFKRGKV